MNWKDTKALRQWIRDINARGLRFGHEDLAGTPEDPDLDYVDRWRAGETVDQVIAADFGDQLPSGEGGA